MRYALAALLALSAALPAAPKKAGRVPETGFLLPALKGISVTWALEPLQEPAAASRLPQPQCFAMDAEGRPWFGDGKRRVSSPAQGTAFSLDLDYDDFCFADSGLIFSSKDTLAAAAGSSKPSLDKKNLPLMQLYPLVKLPLGHARLFAAANGFYFAGKSKNSGKQEVYYLANGGKKFKKVFSTDQAIGAVAGDGKSSFVALGSLVLQVRDGEAHGVYQGRGSINSLGYDPSAGLFFCGDHACGYVDLERKKNLEFFTTPQPRLSLSHGSLYFYVSSVRGVARLKGLSQFKKIFK